jgi:zinc protease
MKKLALAAALVIPTALACPARAADAPEPLPLAVTLPNGLRVIAKEAKGTGLVALTCLVDGGNRTEQPELSGLSHYYEHLVFRGGTAKQAELETRKVFTQLGTFYGYTSDDSTCFYFVVPVSNLDEALWRHVDAVTKVQVTQAKVDKERDVVMNEYRMRVSDSPGGILWHELLQKAFVKHPYGRTVIGLREVIEGSSLERFRSFYEERYVANQMVISVVGDLPAAELVEKVKAHWSSLAAGKPSFELGDAEPPQTAFRKTVTERDGTTQSYLALAFRASAALDEDRVVEDVLSQVLSGGESARLPKALTARRIALSAGAWAPSTKDPGLFAVSLEAEPEKEARALEETVAVLRGLASGGISDDELANAKRRLTTETIFGHESLKDDSIRLANRAIYRDPDLGTTYLAQVSKVTAAAVQKRARELFRSANATLGVVRPKGAALDWDRIVRGLETAEGEAVLVQHPSGARIIIEESHRSRVVALDMRVVGGQLAELEGEGGVAQLVERCLSRGTKQHDRAAFAREWDRLAVRFGTSSDREATSLSIRATDETFEAALALLGEALREPVFTDSEVKSAREETLESIASVEDDSFSLTAQTYADALYGAAHPYGRPVAGTKASVTALGPAQLRAFHERVYRPERFVIAVVGAIDRSRAEALVERHLIGARAAASPVAPVKLAAPETPPARPGTVFLDRKREQVTLDLGLVTVATGDPDYLPLQVASRHLGNELFFRYVYEQGVAYRMWTFLRSGLGARPLTLETGVQPKVFAGVRDGLVAAVTSLVRSGMTPDEVGRAKRDLENRLLLARETNEDRARSLAGYEILGVGFDWEDRLHARLEAVTAETVSAALARRVDPARLTLVVVGDRAALEAVGVKLESPPPARREPD